MGIITRGNVIEAIEAVDNNIGYLIEDLRDGDSAFFVTGVQETWNKDSLALVQKFARDWDELGFDTCQDAVLDITELLRTATIVEVDYGVIEVTLHFSDLWKDKE